MLTDPSPYDNTNETGGSANDDFANGYFNVGRDATLLFAEGTVL